MIKAVTAVEDGLDASLEALLSVFFLVLELMIFEAVQDVDLPMTSLERVGDVLD